MNIDGDGIVDVVSTVDAISAVNAGDYLHDAVAVYIYYLDHAEDVDVTSS